MEETEKEKRSWIGICDIFFHVCVSMTVTKMCLMSVMQIY